MMRFTIIDPTTTTSFLAPPHALKAIAACCALGAATAIQLLNELARFDADLSRHLRDQLAIFNEHNVPGETAWIDDRVREADEYDLPFIVLDETTRRLSLQPGQLGLVIFNLPSRRIIQIQNSYANLERSDRGRVRKNGQPVAAYYRYTLPDDWTIVP